MKLLKLSLIPCLLFTTCFAQVVDQKKVDEKIMQIIKNELLEPKINNEGKEPDWKAIQQLADHYGEPGKQVELQLRTKYYLDHNNYENFAICMTSYFDKYQNNLTDFIELNNYAFEVFKHLDKKKYLEAAIKWTDAAIKLVPGQFPQFLDTKANLLYKSGQKELAIKTQSEAVSLAAAGPFTDLVSEFQEVLQKMKDGKPTWPQSTNN